MQVKQVDVKQVDEKQVEEKYWIMSATVVSEWM